LTPFGVSRLKKDLAEMDSLIIVKPETVIDWQRRRFKKYWTNKSVKRKRLGYNKNYISQRTISRYLKKIRPDVPDNTKKKRQQWKAFLKNYFLSQNRWITPCI